ncbi:PKD repeat protein [Streptacidiphilus sp. MAP12-20]|uniref:PKD domain-containing protein n=1 Tax=Streptacidiphilus sp. MAP12-20 TaxID=3156299 RepID=UPI00351339D3
MLNRRTAAVAAAVVVGVVAAALPTSAVAAGSTLYVNDAATANCSDTAPGAGTAAQPYCGIQAAVAAALPGTAVLVAPGRYAPVDVKTSGTATAPITVTASGPGQSSIVAGSGSRVPALAFDRVQDVVVHGFTIGDGVTGSPTVAVTGSVDTVLESSQVRQSPFNNPSPAVSVDGKSSGFVLRRSTVSGPEQGVAVSVAPGARGTVLTTDAITFGSGPGVSVQSAPGTVIVSNLVNAMTGCPTALDVSGSSTGSTVENNAFRTGFGPGCGNTPVSVPVSVSSGSLAGTTWDYNTVETASTDARYSWGGTAYATAAALHAAAAQAAAHDNGLTLTSMTPADQLAAPLIDSADANAPDELPTDLNGLARVDDPLVTNAGTGVGYYDRGAYEYQDPYTVRPTAPAWRGPVPLAETFGVTESNPWNTHITGYTFDFGDGTPTVSAATASVPHTFTATGTYTVRVTATAATGATFTGTTSVQAVAPAPLVPLLHVAQTPSPALTAQANCWSSTDSWSLTTCTYDFGDGSAAQTVDAGAQAVRTYGKPGTYPVTVTVHDAGGNSATTAGTVSVGSSLVPVAPFRILDTRTGTGAPRAKLGPQGVVRLKVAGVGGIPTSGVTAVVLNLTGVDATGSTWVAAYPDGTRTPTASNLNLVRGQVMPNLVTATVGADGYVDLYNAAGSVDLVADVEGYYTTGNVTGTANAPGLVAAVASTRVLDTRHDVGVPTQKVGPGGTVTFTVPAMWGGDSAVVLNVTVTDATSSTFIAVQSSSAPPTTSVLNVGAGQTDANQVVVPVGAGNQVTLYNAAGSVDLVADLQGYVLDSSYTAPPFGPTGRPYFPVAPMRVLDTRTGLGAPKAPLGAAAVDTVQVAGVHGIPAGVKAVLVNLTGIAPTGSTWLSVYADGPPAPGASNLNLSPGAIQAGLALVPVGSDGAIDVYNASGSVNVAADVEGYYLG